MMNLIILSNSVLFHCNCFVCSMLELIDSRSILIDSCWRLSHIHQKAYFLIGRKCVTEEWKLFKMTGAGSFHLSSVHQGDPAIFPFSSIMLHKDFIMLHKGFTKPLCLSFILWVVFMCAVPKARAVGEGLVVATPKSSTLCRVAQTLCGNDGWGVCVNSVLL